MTNLKEIVLQKFKENFRKKPRIFRSPGRVNLIGEHTDYNGGLVLPAATDKAAYVAIAPSDNYNSTFISVDLNSQVSVNLSDYQVFKEETWANYILGIVQQFQKKGFQIQSFDCVIAGDVPIGSGMSSSAALESAVAFGLNQIYNLGLNRKELALLAQAAENEFIGVKCGIMDMFASIHGKQNSAILLDCQTLDYQYFPLELGDYKIVLFDTNVKHNLAESAYNRRREECEEGLAFFRKYFDDNLPNLSAVPLSYLQASRGQLKENIYKRCQYVIEENSRIIEACEDLKVGNLKNFGIKMTATHEGLRNLYEVSCEELDFLVDVVWHEPSVLGSRMMGGGFGGCTINLIKADEIEKIFNEIAPKYSEKFGKNMKTYTVITAEGSNEC